MEITIAARNVLRGETAGLQVQVRSAAVEAQLTSREVDRPGQPELALRAAPMHLVRGDLRAVPFETHVGAAVDSKGILYLVSLTLAGGETSHRLAIPVQNAIGDLPEPLAPAVGAR